MKVLFFNLFYKYMLAGHIHFETTRLNEKYTDVIQLLLFNNFFKVTLELFKKKLYHKRKKKAIQFFPVCYFLDALNL